jgi:pheromone shutdown protein TraB
LRNFSKNLTWKEIFRFLGDLVKGLIAPQKQLKKYGLKQFDLTKVPEERLISVMMNELKSKYPSIYKSFIDDRDRYMVHKLVGLMREHNKQDILVIVGAGHKKGMEALLLKVDIVR